jgi:1,4-alpha-glucan branching enzyme
MGRDPRAIWLPECAYRPAYITDDGRQRPGLETHLAANKLRLFFAETHMVEGGQPVGVAAGEAIGPYGAVVRRYLVPMSEGQPAQPATTFRPYYVTAPEVAVLARDNRAGLQVAGMGPGTDYRQFHADGISGMVQQRGASARREGRLPSRLGGGAWASPITCHACRRLLEEHLQKAGEFGIVSANYDTGFGHCGSKVRLAGGCCGAWRLHSGRADDRLVLPKASSETVIHLPEGSGAGGTHCMG